MQQRYGLEPPPSAVEDQNRYSWMGSPSEEESQHFAKELGQQSNLPPLPVVPNHLNQALDTQTHVQQPANIHSPSATDYRHPELVLPSQRRQHQQEQEQKEDLQQQGQEGYSVKMQEAALYPGPYHKSQADLSSHALPLRDPNVKQPSPELPKQTSRDTKPIHINPDENPLEPNSPIVSSRQATFNWSSMTPQDNNNMRFSTTAITKPQAIQGGTWEHGACSCVDPSTCMTGIFCPCVLYGKTQYRLSLRSEKKDPTNMLGYSTLNGSCVTWALLCGVNICLTAIQHTRIRKTYEMDSSGENVFGDCIKSICCCCCMLAQDEKEVRYREEGGRKGETDTKEGYVPPNGMTFSPPPR